MTSLLLDTQVLLWAAGDAARLVPSVRQAIVDPSNEVLVSSVSIAEMVIKQSIGKLSVPVAPLQICHELGFATIDLSGADCERMAELPLLHRDPFDRLLIAQSIERHLTLVTSDEQILQYPSLDVRRT